MRLISPSLGECADRMTILELKIEFGKKRGVPVEHFEEEYRQLKEYVDTLPTIFFPDEYKALLDVNRQLWELEDGVRNKKEWKDKPELAVQILKDITRLNDERAEMVHGIDGFWTQEKLY